MADESVESIVDSFGQLSKAMQEVNEIQFNRANTFLLEITKTSKSSGQLWVALARFFSGGAFWRIQNKIKAYSNLLNFRAKMQTEALKKEKENVEQLAKQTKHQKALLNIVEKIGKLREDSVSDEDAKNILQEEQFLYLERIHGTKEALVLLEERSKGVLETIAKTESSIFKEQLRSLEKRVEQDKVTSITMQQLKDARKEEKIAIVALINLEEKLAMAKKINDVEEIARIKERMEAITEESGIKIQQKREDGKFASGNEITGLKGKMTMGERFAAFGEKVLGPADSEDDPLMKFLKNTTVFKMFDKVKSVVMNKDMWVSIGKNAKMMGSFLIKGMMLFATLMFTLLMLKQIGIVDLMKGIAGTLYDTLQTIMEFGGVVLTAGSELYTSLITFFQALFTGTNGEAWVAAKDLINKALVFLGTIFTFGLKVAETFLGGLAGNLTDWFFKQFTDGKKDFKSVALGLFKFLISFLTFHYTRLFVATMMPDTLKLIGGIAAVGAGAGAAYGVGSTMGAFANGGITPGGRVLVGERGPELVDLPRGSRVYSNGQSRGMGNTIHVHVNGRLGASDSEIRDIAQKVGRMVNMEMNRNINSSVRGA